MAAHRLRLAAVLLCLLVPLLAAQEQPVAKEAFDVQDQAPSVGPVAIRYAEIRIHGPIVETLPDVYLLEPDVSLLHEVVERIDTARSDDGIAGVVLHLADMEVGWAKAQELRQAVERLRKANKPVICYLDSAGNADYFVACAADRIVLHPAGTLALVGLRGEVLFWKGLLDKIGVQGDLLQVGNYKGASEPFTRSEASEFFREAVNSVMDDYMRQLVDAVAAARKMAPAAVRGLIDQAPFTPARSRAAGLIDAVATYGEMVNELRGEQTRALEMVQGYGATAARRQPLLNPQQMLQKLLGMGAGPGELSTAGPTIAVLYAVGPIVKGDPDGMLIGETAVNSGRMTQIIRRLKDDANVKAIVVRIDSPGGSAQASDMIWNELHEADRVKPVIVSMSDVAGSGGYYIASAGRRIFAGEGTLTGSIGIMGGKLVIGGLLEKLSLNVEVFQRGANAGMDSMVEPYSPAQREIVGQLMQDTYRLFIDRVAEGRKLERAPVEKMAGGRIWTGRQAVEGKLVDEIGSLGDAVAAAGKAAGLPEGAAPNILRLPRSRSIVEMFLSGAATPEIGKLQAQSPGAPGLTAAGVPRELREPLVYLRALWCMRNETSMAMMPALIRIR